MNLRALAMLSSLCLTVSAHAQCPSWVSEFTPGHADGGIFTSVVYDDGSGPALYVGGNFHRVGTTSAEHVARWNGTSYAPVGAGLGGHGVSTLAVLDIGAGPTLYAGGVLTIVGSGTPTSVARWDGVQWNAVGAQIAGLGGGEGSVSALAVYNPGGGPTLFAAGLFAGGFEGNGSLIREWNGSSWEGGGTDGPGASPFYFTPYATALVVFQNKLYLGGRFATVAGAFGFGVARYGGGAGWQAVTLGTFDNIVTSLVVHDSGAGPELFAGGAFVLGGSTQYFARFANDVWQTVPNGPNNYVTALASIPASGGTPHGVYIGGSLTQVGSTAVDRIARYDGASFYAVGGDNALDVINTITSFDDGTGAGARIHAGCEFQSQHLGGLARLESGGWKMIEPGNAPLGSILSVQSFDDDHDGRASLFFGGFFSLTGGVEAPGFARYDRGTWSKAAPFPSSAYGLDLLVESGTPVLFAGGRFLPQGVSLPMTSVMRLDAGTWNAIGPYFTTVYAVERFGSELWAGGDSGVFRWSGSAWTQPFTSNQPVRDLRVFDDGSGPGLFVLGTFTQLGGVNARGIARWNGVSIDPLVGSGPLTPLGAAAMTTFDDGTGEKLYVAGGFATSSAPYGPPAVARWDGAGWTSIATSFTPPAPFTSISFRSLAVHAGPSGPVLVLGGSFGSIEGVSTTGLAAWDGTTWSAFGGATSGTPASVVTTVLDHDFGDGAGPDLIAVGYALAGGFYSAGVTRYRECGDASGFCFGDGSGTACPCGNVGGIGHGCGNPNFANGALLSVSGRAQVSSDTLTLVCTGISNGTPSLFYQGTAQVNGGAGVVFGDGFACITGALIRLGIRFTTSGEANFGAAAGPGAISTLGFVPGAGGTRNYGCRYRTDLGFCTHAGFGYSNAVSVAWAP